MKTKELTPITDIQNLIDRGKEMGVKFDIIGMTEDKYRELVKSDEFRLDYFRMGIPNYATITLRQMNKYMKRKGFPKIKILQE
jgi:hypothetical protein